VGDPSGDLVANAVKAFFLAAARFAISFQKSRQAFRVKL
jgi:hypothetical protein